MRSSETNTGKPGRDHNSNATAKPIQSQIPTKTKTLKRASVDNGKTKATAAKVINAPGKLHTLKPIVAVVYQLGKADQRRGIETVLLVANLASLPDEADPDLLVELEGSLLGDVSSRVVERLLQARKALSFATSSERVSARTEIIVIFGTHRHAVTKLLQEAAL